MPAPDLQLVERIKARRKSDRVYAATLDSLGKCVETESAQWLEEGQRLSILTAALVAVETEHENAWEVVLGPKLVPVARAICDGIKFKREMFTRALDVLAIDVGCRDFADFQARSRRLGARQLWWKMYGGWILLCVGVAMIVAVVWWLLT